ncbi:uncharacterized protein FOMMEDRAFT_139582 [Fomitiporia mediterranea MF3/22]|uniref:uncharacterized protein n=1 Tax=Fomitiporia mediterranea (strain MF3/22) TaxID=694068 RepID=UPI00044084C8|nr:uncharacterized protein FOMMEDRAFT_139582 [Fomitiporia mediterranea MF3/22]EJD04932.1 hypothetical protein FOMMEDRAFT_139582 [Fomitiporia mediterranea MF3/22]
MHSTLSSSDESEADYFCNFGQFGDSLDTPPAGSASALSLAYQRMFMTDEKQNDDETNIETSMDIDMHALLNLSPIPEVAEIPASMSETTTAQKPFDAVAELWGQGQQVMDGATVLNTQAQTQTQIVPEQRTHMQTQVASPSSKSSSSGFSSENEAGLETYALAVGFNASGASLYNYTCPSTSGSSCTDSLNEDLFHLDLDMDPVLGLGLGCSPAQQLPASALSFTALGGGSSGSTSGPEVLSPVDPDDIFAYDSERGLFSLNTSPGYGYGQGFELGMTSANSGFDYGL